MQEKDWKPHLIEVLSKEETQLDYDGWSIMETSHFTEMGFDQKFLEPMIHRHYSMGEKYDVFDNDGKRQDYIDGIYYLTFLEKVARTLTPDFYTTKSGRGFRAGECLTEISRVLDNSVTPSEG